jgi:23S rRNA pseudouridine1911/1915/1917 synthase
MHPGGMLKVMTGDVEGAVGGVGSSCLAGGVLSAPHKVFKVTESDVCQRLDVFLSHQLKDSSRSHLKTLIKEGEVLINGLPGKPSYEIRSGDRIAVRLPSREHPGRLTPQPMTLDILYEDEDIVVVNKAPGMVVHPGAGHAEGTLVHGLLAHCPRLAIQGAPLRPGIVHRLDLHTSGAMVVAKSDAAYLDLINQFKEHTVEKHYLALVYGIFPQSAGEIRTTLGRHPTDRKKIAVLKGKGREAVTHWRVEKAWEEITLLRVTIETGRTHQIRVHFSHLQHPVIGDATYGGGKRKAQSLKSRDLRDLMEKVDRQMLHAEILAFRHPRTHDPIVFKAPLADDFALLLQQLAANFPGKHRNQ